MNNLHLVHTFLEVVSKLDVVLQLGHFQSRKVALCVLISTHFVHPSMTEFSLTDGFKLMFSLFVCLLEQPISFAACNCRSDCSSLC